jgi:hypothetical protein
VGGQRERASGAGRDGRSWGQIPEGGKTSRPSARRGTGLATDGQRREGAKEAKQFILANLGAFASPISGVGWSDSSRICNRIWREVLCFS